MSNSQRESSRPQPEDGADGKVPPELYDEPNDGVDRSEVLGAGGRWLAQWCLRGLIIGAAAYFLWTMLGILWVGILPILLALVISTVLWPPVRVLTRFKVPASIATLLVMIAAAGVVGGVATAIAPSVRNQVPELSNKTVEGINRLQEWVQGPPLNIDDDQLNRWIHQATSTIQERANDIATGVLTGIGQVGSIVVTLVLSIVLTFFFLKDGPRFLPWMRRTVGRRAGRHLTEVLARIWNTLGGFIRTQAIVSGVDAIFIGVGLVVLSVPLAGPLAILTFFGGFVPIVGAFVAGAFAVLVALVANGVQTAIFVLILVILVQQIEGNVLQPILQSRSMDLHPAIILLAVAAGSSLFDIIGAFLAVPVAASAAVVFRYIGEQTDLRTGDKVAEEVKPATYEGALTAWLGERSAVRFLRKAKAEEADGLDIAHAIDDDGPIRRSSPTYRERIQQAIARENAGQSRAAQKSQKRGDASWYVQKGKPKPDPDAQS